MAHGPKKAPTMSKQVVAQPPINPNLPAYLQGMAPVKRTDNFDASDVGLPRIKLLQGISPECESFDDAKSGNFWHSGMDMNLGPEVRFVICSRRKYYILSAPLEDGQGVLARSDDFKTWDRKGKWLVKIKGQKNPVAWEITDTDVEKSGLAKWGTFIPGDDQSPPAATLFYSYLVILPDFPELGAVLLNLARSQIKQARKGLNDKIEMHLNAGRPMQALVFTVKSVKAQHESGGYNNVAFSSAGFADEAIYLTAKRIGETVLNYRARDEARAADEDRTVKAESKDF